MRLTMRCLTGALALSPCLAPAFVGFALVLEHPGFFFFSFFIFISMPPVCGIRAVLSSLVPHCRPESHRSRRRYSNRRLRLLSDRARGLVWGSSAATSTSSAAAVPVRRRIF